MIKKPQVPVVCTGELGAERDLHLMKRLHSVAKAAGLRVAAAPPLLARPG
ncbi:hypothetical protein [Rhizobium sp. BK176]|nr:hypothetical protein [Rhizobium sp. BK176]MCS4092589.1 hypothetical protein [Rhizobium sp. BK176]